MIALLAAIPPRVVQAAGRACGNLSSRDNIRALKISSRVAPRMKRALMWFVTKWPVCGVLTV